MGEEEVEVAGEAEGAAAAVQGEALGVPAQTQGAIQNRIGVVVGGRTAIPNRTGEAAV